MKLKVVPIVVLAAIAFVSGCSSTSSSSSSSSSAAAPSSVSPSASAGGYTAAEASAYRALVLDVYGKDAALTKAQVEAIASCAWKGITTTIPHDEYVATTASPSPEHAATTAKMRAIATACEKNPSAY